MIMIIIMFDNDMTCDIVLVGDRDRDDVIDHK